MFRPLTHNSDPFRTHFETRGAVYGARLHSRLAEPFVGVQVSVPRFPTDLGRDLAPVEQTLQPGTLDPQLQG